MISQAEKNVIIYALKIEHRRGENVEEMLKTFTRLADAEKYEILKEIRR